MVTGQHEQLVTVHQTPGGDTFAVVINADARAKVTRSADGSAVTIVLSLPGRPDLMPCSLIFSEFSGEQVFGTGLMSLPSPPEPGQDAAESDSDDPTDSGPGTWFTGGDV
jgi:hypothetical protein